LFGAYVRLSDLLLTKSDWLTIDLLKSAAFMVFGFAVDILFLFSAVTRDTL